MTKIHIELSREEAECLLKELVVLSVLPVTLGELYKALSLALDPTEKPHE